MWFVFPHFEARELVKNLTWQLARKLLEGSRTNPTACVSLHLVANKIVALKVPPMVFIPRQSDRGVRP